MTDDATEQQTPEQEPTPDEAAQEQVQLPDPGLWKWYHEPPSAEVVKERLASLPPQFGGIQVIDYIDYVQPLPQRESIPVPREHSRRTVEHDEKVTTYTLYVSVAGRNMMKEAAAQKNDWRIELRPDPDVGPDVPPGYVERDERIVYRMRMEVFERTEGIQNVVYPGPPHLQTRPVPVWLSLGVRYGQAAVPREGGTQAKRTHPFEKVETAAVGRVLGMWGIGVLPGSGIASMEEMLSVRDMLAAGGPGGGQRQEAPVPRDRDKLKDELFTTLDRVKQRMNMSDQDFHDWLARGAVQAFGVGVVDQGGVIKYDAMSNTQLGLMLSNMRNALAKAELAAGMGSQEPPS